MSQPTHGGEPALVNLTGRPLHLYDGGRKVRTIDPGPAFRIVLDERDARTVGGIEVMSALYRPSPLPDPIPGRWLIVSQVAALWLLASGNLRPDILFPGPGVTDRGRTIGCRGLRQALTVVAARPVTS